MGQRGAYRNRAGRSLASPANLRSAAGRLFSRGSALALPPRMARTWLPFAVEMAANSLLRRFAAGKQALGPLLAAVLPAWRRLGATIGDAALMREDDHYVAWETPTKAAAGRASWRAAEIGTATLRDARADEIAAIDVLTKGPVAGAIRFAGTGQLVDLGRLADALEETLIATGGRITRRAMNVDRSGACAEIPGVKVDLILVAAGVASGTTLRGFGHRAPIIAGRGYYIRCTAPRSPADMPPVVFEDRAMIVTRNDDQVQAASFVELGTADAPPDPRKWDRLLRHVRELGLPIKGPYTRWIGARPTGPTICPRSAAHAVRAICSMRSANSISGWRCRRSPARSSMPWSSDDNQSLTSPRSISNRFGGKGGRK